MWKTKVFFWHLFFSARRKVATLGVVFFRVNKAFFFRTSSMSFVEHAKLFFWESCDKLICWFLRTSFYEMVCSRTNFVVIQCCTTSPESKNRFNLPKMVESARKKDNFCFFLRRSQKCVCLEEFVLSQYLPWANWACQFGDQKQIGECCFLKKKGVVLCRKKKKLVALCFF